MGKHGMIEEDAARQSLANAKREEALLKLERDV